MLEQPCFGAEIRPLEWTKILGVWEIKKQFSRPKKKTPLQAF